MSNNSQKKKICCVIASLHCGGAERVMSVLANHFVLNDDVVIVLLSNKPLFYDIDKRVNIKTPKLCKYKILNLFLLFTYVRKIIKQENPDIILSFGRAHNPFVLLSTIGLKIKTFVSDRGNPYYNSGWINETLRRLMYKRATGIISQTSFSKEVVAKTIHHKNITVISNPIREVKPYHPKKEKTIIFMGRLIQGKGVQYLLEAFALIKNKENWSIQILGDGPEKENLIQQAIKLNIFNRVKLVGKVQDVDSYLAEGEIFVFPSLSEGFPNALMEAMANSLACISFDCVTGPSELINDGKNGFLVELKNIKELKSKIEILMENESLRRSFQQEALSVKEKYSTATIAEQYYQFITTDNETT